MREFGKEGTLGTFITSRQKARCWDSESLPAAKTISYEYKGKMS